MTDMTHATVTTEPSAGAYASGGLSAERIAIWIMLLAALAFWIPYTIVVDHAILKGLFGG